MKQIDLYISEKLVISDNVKKDSKLTISTKNIDDELKKINDKLQWNHLYYKVDNNGHSRLQSFKFVLDDKFEHVFIRPEKDLDVTKPLKGLHYGIKDLSPYADTHIFKECMIDNKLGLFYIVCGKMDIERNGTLYRFWFGPHGEMFNDVDDAKKFLNEWKSKNEENSKMSFDIMTLEEANMISDYIIKKKMGNNSIDQLGNIYFFD